MATYTGEGGRVEITDSDSAGSGTNTIAEVRSWTLDHTKEVIDDTVMGDAARTFKHGLHSFTGTMEVIYDSAHTTTTNAFDPSSDVAMTAVFYTGSSSPAQKFSGSVLVTSVSRTASFDDLITATVSFTGSGPLTVATV